MATIDVVDVHKRKVGSVELRDAVFGAKPEASLVHEAVIMQQACERQGSASTLRRDEVSGSGKKPWKQKHTGRARAGSIISPIWVGGAIVFGPLPRDYGWHLPKKVNRAALFSALSHQFKSGNLSVVDELKVEKGKTKEAAVILSALGVGENVLVIDASPDPLLRRAVRNLPKVRLTVPQNLDVYTILLHKKIVLTRKGVESLKTWFKADGEGKPS